MPALIIIIIKLLIDKLVMCDAKENKKYLCVAWIDFKKAFDSVPHAWLDFEVFRAIWYEPTSSAISFLLHESLAYYLDS